MQYENNLHISSKQLKNAPRNEFDFKIPLRSSAIRKLQKMLALALLWLRLKMAIRSEQAVQEQEHCRARRCASRSLAEKRC